MTVQCDKPKIAFKTVPIDRGLFLKNSVKSSSPKILTMIQCTYILYVRTCTTQSIGGEGM